VECAHVGVCLSELQSLDYGEVRAQCRLRAARCLVMAVDSAADAVEITDQHHHTQVLLPNCLSVTRSSIGLSTATGPRSQRCNTIYVIDACDTPDFRSR